MMRPLVLLLACAVSLHGADAFLENGWPMMWTQTAGQVTALPAQNGILTPNPWHYLHRQSLYRLLIAATDPFMGTMGTNATDSPIWGLPLQLAWLLSSGRLADPTGATTCGLQTGDTMCISPNSWWSCQNYFVSVLPFLSAVNSGLMGAGVQVQMQVPEGVEGYCTTYAGCAAAYSDPMSKWDNFYLGLKAAADSPLPDNEKKDILLGLYWTAQMSSNYASAACNQKQTAYSAEEVSFSNSWQNLAEYVAAAHFQSNLQKSAMFIIPLPSRILKAGDSAPNIKDMSAEENHTLSIFSWMNMINNLTGGSLVSMWQKAMCSVATREKGRDMVEQLLLNPSFATSTFLSIITGGC